MQLDFGLLSMTDLRSRPGEVLNRVSASGEAFIIERNGRREACLVPLSFFFPDISPERIAEELQTLEDHGEAPRTTITDSKEMVFRFPHPSREGPPTEVRVQLPHGYPNECPKVYVSGLRDGAPHRWADGALCLYGVVSGWNPGKHTVYSTLQLARQWLGRYEEWLRHGQWPQPGELSHE